MKLDSISIRNLRSIVNRQSFRPRPLTLVVGANSSGKSTFIRTFPLLRQSVEKITRGPVLWFGRFVDFGVFKDAVSRGVNRPEIEFSFTVTLPKSWNEKMGNYYYGPWVPILKDVRVRVKLIVAADEDRSNTYTKAIIITVWDRVIDIRATSDGIIESVQIDGKIIKSATTNLFIRGGTSLFSIGVAPKTANAAEAANALEIDWMPRRQTGAFPDILMSHLDILFYTTTSREKKHAFARCLGIGDRKSLLEQVKFLASTTPTSRKRALKYTSDSPWVKDLQALVLVDRIPRLLNQIDEFLTKTFGSVSYIGPLRATAERFYRQQDLAVDEVDSQGANLAMFLMGLDMNGRASFSLWCQKNIGFSVEAEPVGAHVSVKMKDSDSGDLYNIADMGFGYSQILPVLATIWQSETREVEARPVSPRMRSMGDGDEIIPKFIVIEQPELHLHPRMQGRLADLFCAVASGQKDLKTSTNLICETHSETIVNRVGKLVSQGKIAKKDVQVLVFDKESDIDGTIVSVAEYDDDGVLSNWPYGFFLPIED